jgi:hypothetical protein
VTSNFVRCIFSQIEMHWGRFPSRRNAGRNESAVLVLSALLAAIGSLSFGSQLYGQAVVRPSEPGAVVTMLPSDLAILESQEARQDLPCTVTPKKAADLGFDLRFHSTYDVTIPLKELGGTEDLLTIVFRVFKEDDANHPKYFTQHYAVPAIEEDARGVALLQGEFDLGEGKFHVDWLMRDRAERVCSTTWGTEATLPPKDREMSIFMKPGQIDQSQFQAFVDDPVIHRFPSNPEPLNVKLLVNFAPQDKDAAVLKPIDTEALLSILKAIDHDSRIAHLSLVAFSLPEQRVIFRQEQASHIDFEGLGKALHNVKPGIVDVNRLSQKHGETDFLSFLLEKEVGDPSKPDAVIFAGPKAILNADVPQEDLRRIGDIECPLFYMNYNLYPAAIPWKDSISHAVKYFKGTEYTISKPRDLWFATSEMVNRIARSKHLKTSALIGAEASY